MILTQESTMTVLNVIKRSMASWFICLPELSHLSACLMLSFFQTDAHALFLVWVPKTACVHFKKNAPLEIKK